MNNNEKDTVTSVSEDAVKEKKKSGISRSAKYNSLSVITIVIVFAIVIVVNLMASIMEKRSPMKIDLTPDKRYDLSDETIEVLKNLEQDVEITITMQKSAFTELKEYYGYMALAYMGQSMDFPYDMIPVILEKYEMYSNQGSGKGKVTVKYVDLNNDPDVIAKYSKNYVGDITKNNMIIASGDRVKVLDEEAINNLIIFDQAALQSQTYSLVFAGESTITSEIMNVIDKKIVNVAFVNTINGQNIYSSEDEAIVKTIREKILKKNGYECTDVDIEKDELDTEKYDLVVIPMPQNDFSENAIGKLSNFLYNNEMYEKNMVYIPALTNVDPPNITEFLADWCIKVENAVIGDPYYAMNGDPTAIVLPDMNTEAVGELPNASLPLVAPNSREITVLSKNNQNVITEALKSSESSQNILKLDKDADVSADPGKKNIAVITRRERGEQFAVYKSQLLVLGSSMMLDSTFIDQSTTYNNANVIVNMLNTMTGKETGVVIPEKALQHAVITATTKEDTAIKVIIAVIPAIIAVLGICVLLRRKNR